MKQYQQIDSDGRGFRDADGRAIPADPRNRHYRKMLAEVAASEAEILAYVEPAPKPRQFTAEDLREILEKDGSPAVKAAITAKKNAGRGGGG